MCDFFLQNFGILFYFIFLLHIISETLYILSTTSFMRLEREVLHVMYQYDVCNMKEEICL